jgi:hypothetical protein
MLLVIAVIAVLWFGGSFAALLFASMLSARISHAEERGELRLGGTVIPKDDYGRSSLSMPTRPRGEMAASRVQISD